MNEYTYTVADVQLARETAHLVATAGTDGESVEQYLRSDPSLDWDGATPEAIQAAYRQLVARYHAGTRLLTNAQLIHSGAWSMHEHDDGERERLVRRGAISAIVRFQEGWVAMSPRYRYYALRRKEEAR